MSSNPLFGEKITTIEQLVAASSQGKSVIVDLDGSKPSPAAFQSGLPGNVLLLKFRQGLYIYNTPPNTKRYPKKSK